MAQEMSEGADATHLGRPPIYDSATRDGALSDCSLGRLMVTLSDDVSRVVAGG